MLRHALAVLALSCATAVVAAEQATGTVGKKADENLMEMDLDALTNVKVTSVSKKEEKLTDAAAAIAVVSNEEIKRSGATSLPEALRLVPGIHAGQIDAGTWAVTSRGFNNQFANKMLVLIDGRSVYTPLFSGVYWDVQNVMLEDVDRIEVIRGPGATVWGANAVNGVINVVTKSAKESQGGLVYGGGGTEKQVMGGARYGFKIDENTFGRVYAKYDLTDDTKFVNKHDADDAWQITQGGFRIDHDKEQNRITWQGDGYVGDVLKDDVRDFYGANTIGRFTHNLSDTSSFEVQAYYDLTERYDIGQMDVTRHTAEVTAQHTFAWGERQNFIWGVGYRYTVVNSELASGSPMGILDDSLDSSLYSGFIQDEITLVPKKLKLTLGTKIEHNDFTGWEFQPSGRLTFKPTENQTVWGGVSRAVRTPSEVEGRKFISLPFGFVPPNVVPTIFGSEDTLSEELIAYELGYRIQPHKRVSVDTSVFYNDYDRLMSVEPSGAPFPSGPIFVAPLSFQNELEGEAYGGEATVNYAPLDNVRLSLGYTLYWLQLHRKSPFAGEEAEGSTPRNQVVARMSYDITKTISFDFTVRYHDTVRSGNVPSFIEADSRIAWRPRKNLEASVVGQNLFDSQHPEYDAALGSMRHEVERSVYAKATITF